MPPWSVRQGVASLAGAGATGHVALEYSHTVPWLLPRLTTKPSVHTNTRTLENGLYMLSAGQRRPPPLPARPAFTAVRGRVEETH